MASWKWQSEEEKPLPSLEIADSKIEIADSTSTPNASPTNSPSSSSTPHSNSSSDETPPRKFSTLFKEFHKDLARITELLLKKAGASEAIFFSPKRGNSLDKFLVEIKENGLLSSVTEIYDAEVWKCHQRFMGLAMKKITVTHYY
ncbi:hypothetical protein V6N11_043872 [Hibiscus sabdariffa]|uniref:Uncharacterized protein n=1 Tax=Hibiscus sabdariffa TaxID=183260 RepID=A0ABR2RDJ6_9ROSI